MNAYRQEAVFTVRFEAQFSDGIQRIFGTDFDIAVVTVRVCQVPAVDAGIRQYGCFFPVLQIV